MADLAALHEAVIAAPDDEAPRLAYAKAIGDTDPERRELIELQITLARWRKEHIHPESADAMYVREHGLLRAHSSRWAKDVDDLVDGWQFLRGFVEVVSLDAERFLRSAELLYRRAPVLHLDLSGVRPVVGELFASPHLERIQSLRLSGNDLDDEAIATLASSPHLGQLAWLDLSRNRIGRTGVEALAASDRLPRLRYVGFQGNAIPDPTPRFADEYDADSALAAELQRTYGTKPWLSSAGHRGPWPPERDAP